MALCGHENEKQHADLPEAQQMSAIMANLQAILQDLKTDHAANQAMMQVLKTDLERKVEDQHTQTEDTLSQVMGRLPQLGGQNQMPMPDQQQIRQYPREIALPTQGGVNVAMDDVEVPPPPLGVDNVLERQDPVPPIEEVADNVNEVNQAEVGVYVPPHVRGNGVGNGHHGIHNGHNGHNGVRNGGNGNANGNGDFI
ncbi:hypothetical protein COLO4_04820 [Corchorus olitorius]|uniref:Uncharacterized protein n=1 Tax=Corchorus olitorius TaxID=93759 RepID=A0A1R3KSN5_9ROSI|nr:hypothetical protein COLO4_04820 [Corchorus olitorius]